MKSICFLNFFLITLLQISLFGTLSAGEVETYKVSMSDTDVSDSAVEPSTLFLIAGQQYALDGVIVIQDGNLLFSDLTLKLKSNEYYREKDIKLDTSNMYSRIERLLDNEYMQIEAMIDPSNDNLSDTVLNRLANEPTLKFVLSMNCFAQEDNLTKVCAVKNRFSGVDIRTGYNREKSVWGVFGMTDIKLTRIDK